MSKLDHELATRFVCPKCEQRGALVEHVACTGTGISRWIDLQHRHYAAVTCSRCGFTEFYDLKTLRGSDTLGDILDIIFER